MIEDILFARDFSPSSNRALAYGLDLAKRTGARQHMMYVQVQERSLLEAPKIAAVPLDKLREQFEERNLEVLQQYAGETQDGRLHHHVERDDAAGPALVGFAERKGMDLIVIGTYGRRGVRRVIYGSVAEDVLRTAPCPVLIARAQEEDAPSDSVERIVVPVDFSDLSKEALHYAQALARLYGVPLRALHVVDNPSIPYVYELQADHSVSREGQARAERELAAWVEELDDDLEATSTAHRGEPAETIVDIASEPSDLIVMATRGLSGLRRTMIGSITEEVIRRANGPVIVARRFPEPA
jgi:nucleotide-binding universal stress UspA family protein